MAKKLSAASALPVFEQIKHLDEYGSEFWSARDLGKVFGYLEYRNFQPAIERAKEACQNSGQQVADHFVDMHEMVAIGSGAKREMPSVRLSRYACYLIVQNADPAKEVVALGQTYFAVQTRLQEIRQMADYNSLGSDAEKRLFLRNELRRHNSQLAEAAKGAGVIDPIDYAIFQNFGYQGLYGGLTAGDIHARKSLKKSQQILDHMGSTELAANLFRATQTEEKLRREKIQGKPKANQAHYEVGKKVRQTIEDLGGTMPEDLPAEESIKTLEGKRKKETNRLLPLLALLANFLFFNGLSAQTSVSGTVKSADGEPLVAVSVQEKNAPNGTATDAEGRFRFNVGQPSATLVFSYLGFVSQEIPLAGRTALDVVLEEDSRKIDEVVVTAFGIQRQKREVGYSTEKVKGEDVLRSNAPNIINSLSGRMAGVNITQPNGVEGGTTRIVIRGNNNITGNNQPLIIVDGVPLENDPGFTESPDQKEITGGRDWGSAINNINPADIESLDVLKGANAAALYGARGKNGVILISLKKGRERRGLGVDYNFNFRSIQPFRFRDVQNTFGAGGPVSENAPVFEKAADGTPIYPTDINTTNGPGGQPTSQSFGYYGGSQSWGPRMDGTMIRWWDGQMRPFDPQPDNLRLFYKNGQTASHNIAFSGGSAGSTIRASFTRTDHDAVTLNSNYAQNTVALGGNLKVSSRLRADISMNYIDFFRKNTPALSNDAANSFESGMVYSLPRSYKGENFDYQNPDGTRKTFEHWPYLYVNPNMIWNVWNHNTTLRRDKWLGSLGLNLDATDWLTFSGRVGVDNTNDEIETRRKPIDITGIAIDDGSGYPSNYIGYEHRLGKQKVVNAEGFANFHKTELFRNLDASLRLGGARWQRRDYGIYGTGSNRWRDPLLYAFSNYKNDPANPAAGLPTLGENFYEKRINSLFGFLDLGWKNFLFLQLTGRNDWSSTLPLANNSYFYPSANLSFVATEAFRGRIPSVVSHLKIRAAASQTASDDEPYQLSKIFNSGVFNGQNTGSLPSQIPPIGLRPQRAQSYEGGLELGFWDDRLTADLTYYFLHSYDQLLSSPVPNSSGFNAIRINTGVLDNRGVEAILSARIIQKPGFSWKTGLTFARNRSRLVQLDAGADLLELANVWNSNGPSISVKAGEPYGTIVGFDYVRDEATGKPIVSDDGRFFKLTDTKVPIRIFDKNGKFLRYANATPKFTGGWTNVVSWKNWSLNTLIDVKWGGDMWFGTYALGLQSGQSPETLPEREGGGVPFTRPDGTVANVGVVLEGVRADGQPNTQVVHYFYKYLNAGGWGRANTAAAVRENTWVKCREISLSYQFPARLAAKTHIFQNLSLALTGRDLFYIYATAPDNINPEGSIGAGNAQGLEFASLPGVRTFGLSLGAGF